MYGGGGFQSAKKMRVVTRRFFPYNFHLNKTQFRTRVFRKKEMIS